MADLTQSRPPPRSLWSRVDRVWALVLAVPLMVATFDPLQGVETIKDAAGSLVHTAPFIALAVVAVAYMKATGAEALVAQVFKGREVRMIFLGALAGGLSPFCSCEVIPFIAAMLALGAPLSAVMAFWLSSPLMDPAMFLITSGTLGWDFAIAKAVAAVGIGLLGGAGVWLLKSTPAFADPLRERPQVGRCCGAKQPYSDAPVWQFWTQAERRSTFADSARENATFLLKWLALAYLLESLMVAYLPAEWVAQILGGTGIGPILLGALVGAPAYLNGYAAVPLVDGLLSQGMSPGAAMSFMLAGGASCIPAAVAVWALVRPRVFAGYLGFALTGAVISGLAWAAIA